MVSIQQKLFIKENIWHTCDVEKACSVLGLNEFAGNLVMRCGKLLKQMEKKSEMEESTMNFERRETYVIEHLPPHFC